MASIEYILSNTDKLSEREIYKKKPQCKGTQKYFAPEPL